MILPAISLWQPFCSALFVPEMKSHETRHWPCPERLIGQRVAFHAAKRPVGRWDLSSRAENQCERTWGPDWRSRLTYGAVLGTGVIAGCYPTDTHPPNGTLDLLFGDWSPGRFAWKVLDARLFEEPIAAAGRQGWFTVDIPEALAA